MKKLFAGIVALLTAAMVFAESETIFNYGIDNIGDKLKFYEPIYLNYGLEVSNIKLASLSQQADGYPKISVLERNEKNSNDSEYKPFTQTGIVTKPKFRLDYEPDEDILQLSFAVTAKASASIKSISFVYGSLSKNNRVIVEASVNGGNFKEVYRADGVDVIKANAKFKNFELKENDNVRFKIRGCYSTKHTKKDGKSVINGLFIEAGPASKTASSKPAKGSKEKTAKADNSSKSNSAKAMKVKKIKYDEAGYKAAWEAKDYATCLGMDGKFNEKLYRYAVANGDYDAALQMTTFIDQKDVDTSKDFDKAMMAFYSGNYAEAADGLLATADKIRGVTPDVTGLVKNTFASGDYPGNFYEYILVDIYQALALYKAGNMDQFISAVNAAAQKMQTNAERFQASYDQEELNPEEKEKDASAWHTFLTPILSVAGIPADITDAIIEEIVETQKKMPSKRELTDIYNRSKMVTYLDIVLSKIAATGVDKTKEIGDLEKVDTIGDAVKYYGNESNEKGRIEVLALNGSIGRREQAVLPMKLQPLVDALALLGSTAAKITNISVYMNEVGSNLGFNAYYPVLEKVDTPVAKVKVTVKKNGSEVDSKEASLLEDFDIAADHDVHYRARKTASRNMGITFSSKIPVITTGIVAYATSFKGVESVPVPAMQEKAIAGLRSMLKAFDSAEPRADIRQCVALPKIARAASFDVDDGEYTVEVAYLDAKGNVVSKEESKVTATKAKPGFVASICDK